MDNEFKVDFDEDKEIIVINDTIETFGALNYSISRIEDKDGYGLDTESILIEGIMVTEYYTQDIRKIETARYLLENVEVEKEEFGSKEDNIVYRFKATFARVKYQTTKYDEL